MACQGVVTSPWRAARVRSSRGAVADDGRAGTDGSTAALTTPRRLWAAGAEGRPTRAEPTRARNSWRNEQRLDAAAGCLACRRSSGGRSGPQSSAGVRAAVAAAGHAANCGLPKHRRRRSDATMTVDVPTQLRELAEVGSLSFQRSADSPVRTEFPKLAARLLAKREAHDAAIQSFAEKLTLISDGIEIDVKTASDGVVDALEAVDQQTAAIFEELNRDELLVTKDAPYLTETWEAIEGTLKDRHAVIRDFGARLEGLEQQRAKSEAESIRREEVKAAVAEARETVIKDAAVVARRFLGRMASSSAECFGTLDGLTYNDDLGWLPGDENLFVKRKSLKRLRKMRRKAGPDAEGEILRETGLSYGEGRGRRFPSRTWPGVDAKAFAKVEEPEPAEEPAEEEEDAGETPAEDAPAEEEEMEGPWAGVVTQMGEARDALVTTAHRQLVRARDSAIADYLKYYERWTYTRRRRGCDCGPSKPPRYFFLVVSFSRA